LVPDHGEWTIHEEHRNFLQLVDEACLATGRKGAVCAADKNRLNKSPGKSGVNDDFVAK
jgi:hypothetical protein